MIYTTHDAKTNPCIGFVIAVKDDHTVGLVAAFDTETKRVVRIDNMGKGAHLEDPRLPEWTPIFVELVVDGLYYDPLQTPPALIQEMPPGVEPIPASVAEERKRIYEAMDEAEGPLARMEVATKLFKARLRKWHSESNPLSDDMKEALESSEPMFRGRNK
jgi:hypothetical protein